MNVIYLCGYKNFEKEFKEIEKKETSEGNIVIKKIFLEENYTEEEKETERTINFDKIKFANEMFVINVNNYIDEETELEIKYAKLINKKIRYLEIQEEQKETEIKENIIKKEEVTKEKIEDISNLKLEKKQEIKKEEIVVEKKAFIQEEPLIKINIFEKEKKETSFIKSFFSFIIKMSILGGIGYGSYYWYINYNGKEIVKEQLNKLLEEKQVKVNNPVNNPNTKQNEKSKLENLIMILKYNKSILDKQDQKTKEIEFGIKNISDPKALCKKNIEQIEILKKSVSQDKLKEYLINVNKEIESIISNQIKDDSLLNNYNENNLKVIFEKTK